MSDERSLGERLAQQAINGRCDASLLRSRKVVEPIDATRVQIDGRELINFSGNDYLGLAHHPNVIAALKSATTAGSGAAALVSGRTQAHADAERAIAEWKGVDDAVLLPSGYQANVAAVQAFAGIAEASGRKARFITDKLVHASLIDAMRSTQAEIRVFPHANLAKLERLLGERSDQRLDVVVTESIFSMDGDAADLRAIAKLKQRHGFALLVDEAHATGLYGDSGAGLIEQLRLEHAVDLGVATFSKAAGVVGGAVFGSKAMVEAVVNFGRAYVFTTSPPAFVASAISASIEVMRSDGDRRERLRASIDRLRAGVRSRGLPTVQGDSPIVPVILGDEAATLAAAERLRDAGFLAAAVRPPTVPKGTSRLRITVSSEHLAEQIDALLAAL